MVSILDIYERAYYWHIFTPARRWPRESTALSRSGGGGLRRAGAVEINGPLSRVFSSTGARAREEGGSVPTPAPRWRRGIDVTF